MKKLVLLALVGITQLCVAQSSRLVSAVVQSAETTKPGVWRLVLEKPDALSLTDSVGFVVGVYAGTSPYRNRNLAAITVDEISGNSITVSSSTFEEIERGDVVFLNATMPAKLSFKGKLFKTAINGIFISSPEGQPYYSWNQVVAGTKAWEDQIMAKMLADVKKAATGFNQLIELGAYKGKKVSEVVALSTPATVQTFFTAFERVPQVYAGRSLNFNEEFARWVQMGSLDYSIIDQFVKALAKDSDFENLKKTQLTQITRDFLINLANASNVAYSAGGTLETYVGTTQSLARLSIGVLSNEDLGFIYFNCGTALYLDKKYKDGAEQFARAATAYQGSNDIQYARAVSRQAECVENQSMYEKSEDLFSQAIGLWKQAISKSPSLYNYSRLQLSLEGLAVAASETEQHEKYIAAYLELAGIYKRLGLKLERGNAFWNLGYTYGVKLKQSSQSNLYYEKAYQVFDSIKSIKSAVTVLCNQAINHRNAEDYKSAIELGQRAEAYAKANLNAEAEGYAMNNIMETYKTQGKNDKALEMAKRMEKLYETLDLVEKLAPVKDELASLFAELSRTSEAAKAAEEALKLYQKFANGKDLADAYWNAAYYIGPQNGRLNDVNSYYKKAFDYYKDQSSKSATTLLSNIAINYREVEDSTNSFKKHADAVQYAVSQQDTAAMITAHEKFYYSYSHFQDYKGMMREGVETAMLYQNQRNTEKAEDYYDKVLVALDTTMNRYDRQKKYERVSNTYYIKSQLYQLMSNDAKKAEMLYWAGYYIEYDTAPNVAQKALKLYDQALTLYRRIPDRYNAVTYVENQVAKTYKGLGKYDSAHYHLNLAILLGEEKKYWTNLAESYQAKAALLADQKIYDGAEGAIKYYEKADVAFGKIPDEPKQLQCKKNLATLLNNMERYETASKKHLERIAMADKKDEIALADLYWDYAFSLSNIPSRLKESNDNYLKAAAIYKKQNDLVNYATLISNVGYNYRDANDSVNAYKTFRDLLKVVKPDKPSKAGLGAAAGDESYYLALEKFGHSYKHFGHHRQAMKVRLQAAEGYELLGNNEKAYSTYDDAGKSADAAKKYIEAEKYYYKARDAAQRLGDKKKMGSALWSVAYNKGTYQLKSEEAIPIWETAYTIYLEAGDTADASVMRSNVGQEYWTLLDFNKAIENHNKAIDIATKGKYLTQVASSWRKLADLYKKTQNPTKQSEATNNAIKMLEILKDTTELLPAYFDIGYSYGESQETSKAEDYYNRALALASAKKDSSNMALAYYRFGSLYHSRKPDQAKVNYQKAIVLQRKLKEKSNLIYTLANQGSLLMESDRPLSEKLLNEALGLAKEMADDNTTAYCHARIYDLYRSFGKTDVAHQHMDISNQLFKKVNDKISLANNYISLANEYLYDNGDFTKSQQYMADAKVLLDSTNNPLTLANFYAQQCNIYDDQGQFDLALAELGKSEDIYNNLKNEWGLAGVYIDFGNIYKSQSEYSMALRYQTKSDSLYQKLNLQYQRLAPIANIGDVYFEQGDYPKALDYFKRSLKLMEDNKDQNTNLCKMLSGIGLTYSQMTNYEEAEKWLVRGLETSKRVNATRTGADILNYLGKVKIETKKYDEAEKYLLEAKAFLLGHNLMVERTGNATHLGHLYVKKGDLEKAKAELTEAIALGEKFGKDAVLWEGYFRMGDYYRQSKNLKEAKSYLLKSVGVIDKLRNNVVGGEEAKKLFSSDKWILEAYEELISVLLELGETEEAMAWLQKINENNVRDKIRSMDVTFEDDEKNKTLAREKEMKLKLDAIEKQIAAQKQSKNLNAEQIKNLENVRNVAEGDYLKFVNQTVNVQPELSKYFSNTVQPSQLKGKKKQIPKDMALVSYLVGEKQLYIFVATSDTVVARIVSVTKEKIHRDVNAMTNITKSHLGNFGTIDLSNQEVERKEMVTTVKQTDQMLKPFEEAYHYLISPISELIAGKSKLGIIPTGELNYIPFQMLGKTLKNNKFSMLINQFSMFYTNSTDMLLRTVTGEKAIHILAFGNPDKTLPATEKEVKDIKKIFPNTTVWVQDEATEDKAKYAPEEFNVMHFATHGNLDYEDFSKSYLTMAGNVGKNEDGMLTLEELWGMEVMSHLNIVVLSACQTAVTKGSDESSPVSPASGFLQNGVKSVVATLWKVDDEATSILMNDFYKNIKTMDAVDAMRMAQSSLAGNPKFNHPYYWAAMVLIGDWR